MKSKHKRENLNFLDSVIVKDCARVRAMLAQGANVNARDKEHNQTALMFAVSSRKADMVRLLLDAGADVEAQDDWGRTALFYAPVASEVFEALLLAKANIHARDKEGNTILIRKVSESASLSDVEKLLQLGLDRNLQTAEGETALDIADGLGLLKIVERLRI